MLLKTDMTTYLQVPRYGPRKKVQQLLRRSKSILAEWKLNSGRQHIDEMKSKVAHYRPNGPHFPDRYGYRQSRSIISISTPQQTYQAQHSIGFSISLHQTEHQSATCRLKERLTRRNPCASFRNTAVPLSVSYASHHSMTYLYGLLEGLFISKRPSRVENNLRISPNSST